MTGIRGSFRVKKNNKKNVVATIQYDILFLDDSLVFARIGGHWANMTAPKPAKQQEQLKRFSRMTTEEILKLHKHNFQIQYNDIVGVKLRNDTARSIRTGILQITTLNEATFEIAPYQDFEACKSFIRAALPGKFDESNIPPQEHSETIVLTDEIPMAESRVPWGIAVQNARSTPFTGGTAQSQYERAIINSANWFFIIAGLSVVNSIIYFSGSHLNFLVGLGITQFISGIAKGFGGQMIPFAMVLTFLLAGLFVFLGIVGKKQKIWPFVTGMSLYALDGLLFIWAKYWPGIIFHAFVLFLLFGGTNASFKLNKSRKTIRE